MSGRRIDLVFPRFKLLSGAERLILELAGALARKGHRPRVVCHRFDASCEPLLYPGVELAETGARLDWFSNRYLNAVFDYARVGSLRRLLDPAADARVLYGPALRIIGRGRERIPEVYHCFEPPRALYQDRDAVLDRAGPARWPLALALSAYRRIDRRLVRRAGAITASGPYAARRVEAVYGRPAIPITHGLARDALAAGAGAARHPARMITVNYLHPRKRVDLVIAALAQLGDRTPAGDLVELEIVGGGPERARLEALAHELGVTERVRFAGFVPESELPTRYRAAACYVHAAREESFGLSVIEAAYCGLPVVAVAEGGVVDNVREGETGFLVDADAGEIAAGVRRVLWSGDGGRAMGQRGHDRVDALYTWESGAEDLLRAIDSAL